MTIAFHTGAAETRRCSRCDALVEHRESSIACGGTAGTFWMAEKHNAPCGLPCSGGGVQPKQIRETGAHGLHDRCPAGCPMDIHPLERRP